MEKVRSCVWPTLGSRTAEKRNRAVADLGGAGGAAAPPLASFTKIHGLPISKTVRTADSTIIIIANFTLQLAQRNFLKGRRERGHEGAWGTPNFQRHQLPHPPCKNPGSATGTEYPSYSPLRLRPCQACWRAGGAWPRWVLRGVGVVVNIADWKRVTDSSEVARPHALLRATRHPAR